MGERPKNEFPAATLHGSILLEVWRKCCCRFNGSVANLTEEEARKLATEREEVVPVFPNGKKQLHTTRSWDFMHFSENARRLIFEGNVIVGMLDTGIWPDSKSFSDESFGPPPQKRNGTCQESSNFTCNNKIIGARYYRADGQFIPHDVASPLDTEGHGSHTASSAAGDIVQGARLLGLGLGDTRGGVPGAHLAVYKICWSDGCYDSDILAAFDDAIADDVDIISLLVGGFFAINLEDSIAIGSFHAMKNDIMTSNSAGNSGPLYASTSSVAPWALSVAAGTLDRKSAIKYNRVMVRFISFCMWGISIKTFDTENNTYPFIYAGDAGLIGTDASYCDDGTLDKNKVEGKIVLCDAISIGTGPAVAGALGMVMQNLGFDDVAFSFILPASYMSNGSAVFSYVKSTENPTAKIFKSDPEVDVISVFVVSFSSRGPNIITPDILKPDTTGPGLDMLAAWSEATTVTGFPGDTRVVPCNIISGTSMSCPHASGAAAYIKSFYPTWSPAAIKSALMTTDQSDDEFSYGAGHINLANATNPGLVYDAGEIDCIKFLCGQGYNDTKLKVVARK
ncbi:hypothetical protein SLEP1_g37438 [Rubroshorea leprosula]|uniref:Peptidase S8/S53 domain-containing protein n=1 Tax=Rubroshorea leprosula TaxID=152421 RepID=A0AAV5KV68_9ROSI|nr:hypothetical protein SLEP1_g37438 [Rubroshorea leprosula]